MKYLYLLLFTLSSFLASAQDFYDLGTIQTIELTFAENNWDQLLDTEYAGAGGYILAESVSINGVVFDSIGVKYKGNSTYRDTQVKNPFHIELDTYKDHEYDGYTDIKLSNVAKDPSFLREVLSYQVIGQYMDAPLSNYANVFVNGTLIGLYSNSESISKKFVNSRFNSKSNTFVKCNPPAGAGPQSNDFPNLVYLGEDSAAYEDAYELKSDFGWNELIDLCDTLKNQTDAIEDILDVDRALWMLALDNVLVNLDSYIGGFAQNYYLYRDDNGRFVPVIWDLNESFGRFTMTGSGSLNSTQAKQQMSHLLHENDTSFPLMQELMAVPMYKRMYLAHYKTILLENFDNNNYRTVGEELQELINDDVQADNNKFFTYNNFIDNFTSDVNAGGGGPGGGAVVGIASLMDGRNSYLLGLSDFSQTDPTITEIEYSNSSPIINENLGITGNITDASRAYLGYRSDEYGVFTKVEMFDDGMHNDGAAGDNVYGTNILIQRALTQFYIYAENDNAGKFSPQRAEHEYHVVTATSGNTTIGDLVINELMASNDATQADQDGEFDDWIELYNNGTSAIDLEGYFLSDDFEELMKWPLSVGATIAADGYFVIWADNDEDQEGNHANFKLSAAGESLFLVDPSGDIIDEVTFASQESDISFGRFPNGTGDFQTMSPTFNALNTGTSNVSEEEIPTIAVDIFPNPANDRLNINSNERIDLISIYNTSGIKIFETRSHELNNTIQIENLVNGMYIVHLSFEDGIRLSKVIIKSGED